MAFSHLNPKVRSTTKLRQKVIEARLIAKSSVVTCKYNISTSSGRMEKRDSHGVLGLVVVNMAVGALQAVRSVCSMEVREESTLHKLRV